MLPNKIFIGDRCRYLKMAVWVNRDVNCFLSKCCNTIKIKIQLIFDTGGDSTKTVSSQSNYEIEISKLKTENVKLRRQNSQLTKSIEELESKITRLERTLDVKNLILKNKFGGTPDENSKG